MMNATSVSSSLCAQTAVTDGGQCANIIPTAATSNVNSSATVLYGNIDPNTVVTTHFETPFIARLVRLHPVSWHNGIALRMEMLGCDESERLDGICFACASS